MWLVDNFGTSQWYVISSATGTKYYIRRDSTCSAPNFVYMAYCKKCKNQGVRSTISSRPRLHKNKSYVEKNVRSQKIATHFIDECCDDKIPFKYLAFVIIDVVNNTSDLTLNRIENLFLKKEKNSSGHLVTPHQGLNSTHYWNHFKQT